MTTNTAAVVPAYQDTMQRVEKKADRATDIMVVQPINTAVVTKQAAKPKVGQAGDNRANSHVVATTPVSLAERKPAPKKAASRRVSKTKPLRMTESAGFQPATEDVVTPNNPGTNRNRDEQDLPNRNSPVSVLENLSYAKSPPKKRNAARTSSNRKSSLETVNEPSEESDAYTTDDDGDEAEEASDDQASIASSDTVGTGVEEGSGLKLQERFDLIDQMLAGKAQHEEPSTASAVAQDVDMGISEHQQLQSPDDEEGKKASQAATLHEEGDDISFTGTSVLVAATKSKKVAIPRKKVAKGSRKTRPHKAARFKKSSKLNKATSRLGPDEETPTSVLMFEDFKKPPALMSTGDATDRSSRTKRVRRKS